MRAFIPGLVFSIATLPVTADHMEEVVVSGSHEKRTIDVVDELTIAADSAQLLKKAPDANVNGNGPLTGIPQYRGMYGPRVGVQLNGTQLAPAGPNWMDPPLSYAAAAQRVAAAVSRHCPGPCGAGIDWGCGERGDLPG